VQLLRRLNTRLYHKVVALEGLSAAENGLESPCDGHHQTQLQDVADTTRKDPVAATVAVAETTTDTINAHALKIQHATLQAENLTLNSQLLEADGRLVGLQACLHSERGWYATQLLEQRNIILHLHSRLFNTQQGVIRVVGSIRPVLAMEAAEGLDELKRDLSKDGYEIRIKHLGQDSDSSGMYRHRLSKILDGGSDEQINEEIWPTDVWQSVAIFCYGGLGSGKTYSMHKLLLAALRRVLEARDQESSKGRKCEVVATFVVLDNERAYDLLNNHVEVTPNDILTLNKHVLPIMRADAQLLLHRAITAHQVAQHSKSHAIFRLAIQRYSVLTGTDQCIAYTTLVDMADSDEQATGIDEEAHSRSSVINDLTLTRTVLCAMAKGGALDLLSSTGGYVDNEMHSSLVGISCVYHYYPE